MASYHCEEMGGITQQFYSGMLVWEGVGILVL